MPSNESTLTAGQKLPVDLPAVTDHDPRAVRQASSALTDHLLPMAGGRMLLRGVSCAASAKRQADRLPRLGPGVPGRDDFERIRRELGINAIRLLTFWEAVEPSPGCHDFEYLDSVRALATAAGEAGMAVLIDFHQDLFGPPFGEAGAPPWAAAAAGVPFRRHEPWMLGYLEPNVRASFDRLYDDPILRASYVGSCALLARHLAAVPAVFGYDLLNEPGYGRTGVSDLEERALPRLYAEAIDAIRLHHPDAWAFLQPAPISSVGCRTRLEVPDRTGVVYAPHLYPIPVEVAGRFDGDGTVVARIMGQLLADAGRMGRPLVIGEVGVRRDTAGAADYLATVAEALDAACVGGFYWELGPSSSAGYGLLDPEGRPAATARAIARLAPRSLNGTLVALRTWPDTGWAMMRWVEPAGPGVGRGGATTVGLPTATFGRRWRAWLEDGGVVREIDGDLHIAPLSPAGGSRGDRERVLWVAGQAQPGERA